MQQGEEADPAPHEAHPSAKKLNKKQQMQFSLNSARTKRWSADTREIGGAVG
jgi:hypothetical protein